MAYRSDVDALAAQCDALRRELERATLDAAELERIRTELRDRTRELARLRAEIDPALAARRRAVRWASLGAVATLAATMSWWITRPTPAPPLSSSRAWFEATRPHCNPLEVRDHLSRSHPPADAEAEGYVALCWALGAQMDDARRALVNAGPRRAAALQLLFNFAHPIADRGDDRAAGPIMSLVVEEWPTNYMAMYHAGMSDYAAGENARAKTRLEAFLGMYHQPDGWTANAKRALAGLEQRQSFAQAFGGVKDPRIE